MLESELSYEQRFLNTQNFGSRQFIYNTNTILYNIIIILKVIKLCIQELGENVDEEEEEVDDDPIIEDLNKEHTLCYKQDIKRNDHERYTSYIRIFIKCH